ncbi:MAG TPA: hypothetical protein VEK15_15490 [Vicinamibacteria bacterium]|nr:hypothetical protein [Vicinamibacteria bacterium]
MPPSLHCPGSTSDTGAYRIAWSGTDGTVVRVEENGSVLYEGVQDATTVSGRPAGDYVYRLGLMEGGNVAWNDSCTVTVAPPSLALAGFLFAVGFSVFASLLVVVVRGHRAHRSGELYGRPHDTSH